MRRPPKGHPRRSRRRHVAGARAHAGARPRNAPGRGRAGGHRGKPLPARAQPALSGVRRRRPDHPNGVLTMPEVQASDGAAFLRQWAEVAYDKIQLAQIAAIQEMMVNYATMAWRPMTI